MTPTRFQIALAQEGLAGVLLEVVDGALNHAAAQHSAVCNRSLYAFAQEIKQAAQSLETSLNTNDHVI